MEKEIKIDSDVDKVTLVIPKDDKCKVGPMTLREAIMRLPADTPLRIVVLDGGITERGCFVRNSWSLYLGKWSSDSEGVRRQRIEGLNTLTLCDMGVLLDERPVEIGICHDTVSNGPAFTVTLEANPEEKE